MLSGPRTSAGWYTPEMPPGGPAFCTAWWVSLSSGNARLLGGRRRKAQPTSMDTDRRAPSGVAGPGELGDELVVGGQVGREQREHITRAACLLLVRGRARVVHRSAAATQVPDPRGEDADRPGG